MYQRLLQILFAQDYRFLTMSTEGIPDAVAKAVTKFWSRASFNTLPLHGKRAPKKLDIFLGSLQDLAEKRIEIGDLVLWRQVAQESAVMARTHPLAGVLVALQAMAAWVGILGEKLDFQPWEGHHPGWHVFPLVTARNLVAAEAIWSARYLCDEASGFIESAKYAPFNEQMRGVISEYEAVRAMADQIYENSIAELAWALQTNVAAEGDTFRAELAALFWTSGDVLHAQLLRPDGPAEYLPPYSVLRTLVDHSIHALPWSPLSQYIWLDMKDRGPFSLREHNVIFGRINNRFAGHPLHMWDEILPYSFSRSYAKVVISWMRGNVEKAAWDELVTGMSIVSEELRSSAPDAYLRVTALATLVEPQDSQTQAERWRGLTDMATSIIRWADRNGIYEPFDHVLDAPFYELSAKCSSELEHTLDCIEAYRQANLGYWLSISGPIIHEPVSGELFVKEQTLLRELRGARFIRLLPYLPRHYQRYGFKIDEALAGPPLGIVPSEQSKSLLKFNPFDQQLAKQNLGETRDRLLELYEQMEGTSPKYAAVRATPPSSAQDFRSALNSHRTEIMR